MTSPALKPATSISLNTNRNLSQLRAIFRFAVSSLHQRKTAARQVTPISQNHSQRRHIQLLIPGLQNLIVRTFEEIRQDTKITSTTSVRYVYENTCEKSPLRKLLLHQCACHLKITWFRENPQQFPKQFLLDLAELGLQVIERKTMKEHVGLASNRSQYEVDED
ncbi:hypothetical protein LOCC1_G005520 [Lachnellula occidentalis]|uniref:Uncharacterized protein n=1 Tax=Lachnellula occidentalis TaxID=215460 RepID=A0A8H8U8Q4_9HELO|nr:hypothetical protein LOCC1_G005520 [Lachnellula occidentalis]